MLRVREAREARGWSQEQLAEAVNTTQQTIQRWESGKIDVKLSKIKDISHALGITMSFILGIEDEQPETPSELSPDEQRLIELYRNMDIENRKTLMSTACAFSALGKKDGPVRCGDSAVGTVDAVK